MTDSRTISSGQNNTDRIRTRLIIIKKILAQPSTKYHIEKHVISGFIHSIHSLKVTQTTINFIPYCQRNFASTDKFTQLL